jgi:hypothetical protein
VLFPMDAAPSVSLRRSGRLEPGVWAPAWVVAPWSRLGRLGAAPSGCGAHGGLHITHIERHIHPSSYCFVREQYLASAHVHQHIVPPAQNTRLVQVTKNVTNYTTINKQVVNQSIHVENIEKASKRPVPRLRLVDADHRRSCRRNASRKREGQVRVFLRCQDHQTPTGPGPHRQQHLCHPVRSTSASQEGSRLAPSVSAGCLLHRQHYQEPQPADEPQKPRDRPGTATSTPGAADNVMATAPHHAR